ncbi:MAG: bifunctional UDP-N-acetylglucosamine diphosphorylase/glucosamine-1-phosphate N-acetyltransferase GlmU [Alphaproteobacteria bacterium]|nr:bifunctional UDP-N-acetylglucosamine diphosphorylase/glucosamine-1-phosphate N-acetyltransferase GlmU [Alphaproteobacteria bacterium]
MSQKLACIILAAGKGNRMKSALPKPLHPVAGLPMVSHVVRAAEALTPEKIIVVIGNDGQQVADTVKPHTTAMQTVPNGTGGAALAAKDALAGFDGDILVIFGDTPMITPASLQKMVDARRQLPAIGAVFSGIRPKDPAAYGRMMLDDDGTLKKIVEFKDATAEEKKITLCNGGVVCADGAKLFDWLAQIGNDNAQGEYYLTDLPQIARKDNRQTLVVELPEEDVAGVNDRVELAHMERAMQQRLRKQHMLNGVTLVDPETVYFSADTIVGQDTTIEPNVWFGTGVTLADNVTVKSSSYIEGADIAAGASIGPFARIRSGTRLGPDTLVGHFVEIKNTHMAKGAKAKHLSYLGDGDVGENVNIGAGTIFCNYDGYFKHKTKIGNGATIGANTALIAPVTIGAGAYIGAGSAIYQDVKDNALALTRAPQLQKEGWAVEFRRKKMKEKAEKK